MKINNITANKEQFSDVLFQIILPKVLVRPWKRHEMYVRKKSSQRIEIDKEKSNIDGGSEKAKALKIWYLLRKLD